MTPRSDYNKTAPAAVLHGSMFSKPCASVLGRLAITRGCSKRRALRLLYHDAAKRPSTKLHLLRFCMVQCSQSPASAKGRAMRRAAAQAAALRLLYHDAAKMATTKPHLLRFCMVQCSQSPVRQHRACATRAAAQAAALRLLYHISNPRPTVERHRARPMHRTRDTPAPPREKGEHL